MANLASLCLNDDCSTVADAYTKAETDAAIASALSGYFKVLSGQKTGCTLAAGASGTFAVDINNITGYEICGYRAINMLTASGGAINGIVIQWFSTTGNGTKAQVKLLNTTDEEKTFSLTVNVFVKKA